MNSILKGAIISTVAASLSFGVAFATQIKANNNDSASLNNVTKSTGGDSETIERKPLTNQQKFLNSLGGTQGFDVNANVLINVSDSLSVVVAATVKGDASDISNIKLDGNADVNISDTSLNINFSYFDSAIYFDFNDSYFKMDVDSLTDFVSKLSESYGISFSLPSQFSNFSISSLEQIFLNMPEKEETSDGYFYNLKITNDIVINWKTNENDEFLGLKTSFTYQGVCFDIDIDLKHVDPSDLDLTSPSQSENKDKYQDFEPVFTIFDGIYNLVKKNESTLSADIKISKDGNDFISTYSDFSYDLINKVYSISGNLLTRGQSMPYGFALSNSVIYADYSDLHVSLDIDSISKLINFFLNKVGNEEFSKALNTLTTIIENPNLSKIVHLASEGLGTISLTSDELQIGLLPSLVSDKLANIDDISLSLSFTKDGLTKIDISEFSIGEYSFKVSASFESYKPYTFSNTYQALDPLSCLPNLLENYSKQSQFAIEFDGKYQTVEDGLTKELSICSNKDNNPSYIQFTLDENRKILDENGNSNDNGFGYGEVTIKDYDGYLHNVKVDLKSVNEVLFSYNSTLNGKIKIQTLKDLYELIRDITIDNPDDHMKEIINKIFDSTSSLPLKDIISGDYTLLLITNIVNSLEVTDSYLLTNISLDILSMSNVSFDLKIEYESGANPSLKALKFSNLNIDGITENKSFEFNAYLKEYDFSKDASETFRLDRNANYIDFGDLKVLLQLGINTSKFNYYHFEGSANVRISSLIEENVPLDIKVWSKGDDNHNSDVEIDVYLKDIPTIYGFNGSGTRNAHIYYHNKMFYVERTDVVTEWFKKKTKNYAGIYTPEYFSNNIMKILLQDVMGFNDTVYGWIESSKTDISDYQIPYEKILNDFKYNEPEHNFYFDLDIAALSNNNDLKTLIVTARVDETNTKLVGVDVSLGISVGISINLDLSLNLLDDSSFIADDTNRITNLETFESLHSGDTLNTFRQL